MQQALDLFETVPEAHKEAGLRPAVEFTVYGTPRPAGSKRAVPVGKKGGPKRWVVTDDNKKSAPWKDQVSQVAGEAMEATGVGLLDGPLAVVFRFVVNRPKGHLNSRGELNAAGRRRPYPTVKPDALKLARGVEDAMSGVVYRDDAQIVRELLEKDYGSPERVEIRVYELPVPE